MKALTDPEIRASFVNCTKGEAGRAALPRELAELTWEELDFLGWRDPGAPDRGYLVAEHGGRPVGVALRLAQRGPGARHGSMCSICLTTHPASGVALMTARRAGRPTAGAYASAGEYFCADLACSLYVRGRRRAPAGGVRMKESLSTEEKVARVRANLAVFLDRVLGPEG
ncbi:FBP domain-containing protein [Streptomyces sp. TLI_171]|uniref:FBP domain-containing protein n=1 Tax=Streptomyces sp. TLI_171 TaxID=1938859 RepID=UPI000C19FF8C|nr:FBP domain-containing protein [Streptomyces sp. TLI_171]RKE18783.1 treble-clef zinc-finger protein [Streptomyces sp. TLI_171]